MDNLDDFLNITNSRLSSYFDVYRISISDVVYIQILFRLKDVKLLSEFSLDKPSHVSVAENVMGEKILNIPVSVNEGYLGKPLTVLVDNGFITNIILKILGKDINFLDIIKEKAKYLPTNHRDDITRFEDNFKFYHLKEKTDYVLAVNIIDNLSIEKIRYSLGGVLVNHVLDVIDNDVIVRKSDLKEITLRSDKIVSLKQNIKLLPLTRKIENKNVFMENKNIGVIDSETFMAKDGVQKIYAIGFKTNLDEDPVIYYISNNNMNPDEIILSLINELLRSKYEKTTFYCHNFSNYDAVFIMHALDKHNKIHPDNVYKIDPLYRDGKPIKVSFIKGKHKFSILDSYCMLPESLAKLGKIWGVKTLKSIFPYKFATEDNLFYRGVTPSFDMYNNITRDVV